MDYIKVQELLADSPTVRLIRAQNAPLILGFLLKEFKDSNRIVISNDELIPKLSDYMEEHGFRAEDFKELAHSEEGLDMPAIAKRYLDQWSDHEILRKFPNNDGIHMHELTPETERALQWVESLVKRKFVGTESRFKDIFKKMHDLVENTQDDPQEKILELERKKQAIEEEIRQVKITQQVQVYDETQVKERFYELNKLSRELLADFKEVEGNFKGIIRNIYEKQTDRNIHRGQIVGYALDAVEHLKKKDQGRSFYTFWNFLISDKSQDELRTLTDRVLNLLREMAIEYEDDRFIRQLKTHLYYAGKKVIDSNRQLSARLSKVLSEREVSERRKVLELIGDIRTSALKVVAKPPKTDSFIVVDGWPEVSMVMARPLADLSPENVIVSQPSDVEVADLTSMNFNNLFNTFMVKREHLQVNIDAFLKEYKNVSLAQIVEKYPIEKGLSEVLTYLAIASQSSKHSISTENHVLLPLDRTETRFAKIPQVVYNK